jgi:DNA invertase Pin-like site-specific DNA recombinase
MIPFKTTPDQVLQLAAIVVDMQHAGLDREFIVHAFELAHTDQGVYDLMALWVDATDEDERDEVVADIQESLDDYRDAPASPEKRPYIKYDELGDVAQRVMAEKAKLRQIIDQHGGVSAVAKKCGIPQPSLSRMLSSPSVPRRATLYKIANALDLSEKDIALEWTR